VDEQKGYSKVAGDVRRHYSVSIYSLMTVT
jgi:hypothetical protein